MNLGDIQAEIADALRFGPNIEAYNDRMVRRIEQAHQELCALHPWQFAVRELVLPALADVTATCNVNLGSTLVVVTAPAVTNSAWQGQTLVVGQEEHTIGLVSGANLQLTENYSGATAVGVTATVRMDKYLAPVEVQDVLDVFDRGNNAGVLHYLSRATEAEFLGGLDQTGTPNHFSLENVFRFEAPVNIMGSSPSTPFRAVALSPGTPQLDVLTRYRYFFTLSQANNESQPSNIVSHTTGAGPNVAVRLEGLPLLTDNVEKRIWREDPKYGAGAFRNIGTATGPAVTYDDTAGDPMGQRWWDLGTQMAIRFYPRPATNTNYHIRYYAKPFRLQRATDAPFLPPEHHRLIVHKVVAEVATSDRAMSAFHEKKLEEGITLMKRTYLIRRADGSTQRRLWGSSSNASWVQPIVTWVP